MTQSDFISLIKKALGYEPTPGQEKALTVFSQFLATVTHGQLWFFGVQQGQERPPLPLPW